MRPATTTSNLRVKYWIYGKSEKFPSANEEDWRDTGVVSDESIFSFSHATIESRPEKKHTATDSRKWILCVRVVNYGRMCLGLGDFLWLGWVMMVGRNGVRLFMCARVNIRIAKNMQRIIKHKRSHSHIVIGRIKKKINYVFHFAQRTLWIIMLIIVCLLNYQ